MMILRWMDGTTVRRGEVVRLEFDYPKQVCTVVFKAEPDRPIGPMYQIPVPDLLDAYLVR